MSVNHHGEDGRQRMDDMMKRFLGQGDRTTVREYPEGRMGAHDEGSLAFTVGTDEKHRTVVIEFNKPVAWMAMSADDAARLAGLLIEKAKALGGKFSVTI